MVMTTKFVGLMMSVALAFPRRALPRSTEAVSVSLPLPSYCCVAEQWSWPSVGYGGKSSNVEAVSP